MGVRGVKCPPTSLRSMNILYAPLRRKNEEGEEEEKNGGEEEKKDELSLHILAGFAPHLARAYM